MKNEKSFVGSPRFFESLVDFRGIFVGPRATIGRFDREKFALSAHVRFGETCRGKSTTRTKKKGRPARTTCVLGKLFAENSLPSGRNFLANSISIDRGEKDHSDETKSDSLFIENSNEKRSFLFASRLIDVGETTLTSSRRIFHASHSIEVNVWDRREYQIGRAFVQRSLGNSTCPNVQRLLSLSLSKRSAQIHRSEANAAQRQMNEWLTIPFLLCIRKHTEKIHSKVFS